MKKITVVFARRELERQIDIAGFLRGEAQWTNGYRSGNPKREAELHEQEVRRWKQYGDQSEAVEGAIARLIATVRRDERDNKRTKKPRRQTR